ncbi:hypothetical protein ACO9S2_09825 [Nitrospira sp. NS4]|uniref:hypothetical protein n=1 Tax=Nitrospira sp. NS4 TaxID=3414498 RepID=UPI003C30052F
MAAWLLLLSGMVYPQLAAHASEHAHHAATTHATALCSWLCAAGQTAEDAALLSLLVVSVTSPAFHPQYCAFCKQFVVISVSRGPPSVLAS